MTSPKLSSDAFSCHDERRQSGEESSGEESPRERRVVAYTMAGEECCLPAFAEVFTFPANWTVRTALTSGPWVRRAREGEDATLPLNCVFLDFDPQAIIHSVGCAAMPGEFLGTYGEYVTVLATESRGPPPPRTPLTLPPISAGHGASSPPSPPLTLPPGAGLADYDAAAPRTREEGYLRVAS